tara:strand:- start:4248 stop:5576 length:1329 start_codon:yes stop_codon:yes gene_type:complete
MASLGFDLSINNYTLDDLLGLLGLGSNPSIPEINNKLQIFIDRFRQVDNANSAKIIDFFGEVGSRLEQELFEDQDYEATNLYSDMNNNNLLNPEELLVCEDSIDQELAPTSQERIIMDAPENMVERHYNYEFSVFEQEMVSDVTERTRFKFRFNELLTNVKELYLSKIVIPMPYTISSYLHNNEFAIIDNSSNERWTITIEDSHLHYYTDIEALQKYLNSEYFNPVDNSDNILGNITVSILPKPSSRFALRFDLSTNNPMYSDFSLDFRQEREYWCRNNGNNNNNGDNNVYALNKLLGFNEQLYLNVTRVDGSGIFITQPKLYISLDDNQIKYNQNLRTIGQHTLKNNIIGTIYLNAADLAANDHILYNQYTITEVTQNGRIYDGLVNLDTLTVRFYDVNGILQQIPREGYDGNCFYFVFKITRMMGMSKDMGIGKDMGKSS